MRNHKKGGTQVAAEFKTGVLTTKGLALLAKWQFGATPVITRIAIGSGTYTDGEDLTGRTSLKSQKLSVGVTSKTIQNSTTVLLKAIFSNSTLAAGFSVTEIGVFATDPDEGEILYSMAVSADEAHADFLPAYNGTYPSTLVFNYQLETGNASSVTIQANMGAYASADDVNAMSVTVGKLVTAVTTKETGSVTLTNSKEYPFNDSRVTVSLSTTRHNLYYDVETVVMAYSGGLPGSVTVTDKQLNGFKLGFDGSASSVTVTYRVKEGMELL